MALSKELLDFLKEFKEGELTDKQVEDGLNKALGATHVPKAVFNEKLEEVKSATSKITEYEKQVKELEKQGNLTDDQQKTIDDLKAQLTEQEESYKSQLTATKRTHALEDAIRGAKARDVKSVMAHIDQANLAWNDNNTLAGGLKEQLEALQQEKGFLFEVDEPPKEPKPSFGGDKGGSGKADTLASAFAGALGVE